MASLVVSSTACFGPSCSTWQPAIAAGVWAVRKQQQPRSAITEPRRSKETKLLDHQAWGVAARAMSDDAEGSSSPGVDDEEAREANGAGSLLSQDPSAVPGAAKFAVGPLLDNGRDEAAQLRGRLDDEGEGLSHISSELASIYSTCRWWVWHGFRINYSLQGNGPPLLLVHGFGASIGHWRRNIGVLAHTNKVYAIDLLGLGASEKPPKFKYTMETWAELLLDFIKEVIGEATVLMGNSIGSLACTIVAAEAPEQLVRGLVLLNCSGGMNNKAVVDDWRIKLFLPLLWLIDFLLLQPSIASRLFNQFQAKENLKNVLQSVYCNPEAVDEELIEVIGRPAQDPGALDAFVSIITGPPGPSPISLFPRISIPVLVLWGDKDPFTPIDGPVGKFFTGLVDTQPNVQLVLLADVGHCPHDDRPDLVHKELLPWLALVNGEQSAKNYSTALL